jgi:hypothetical protein
MIFDTGSNWLWVSSRLCVSCPLTTLKFDERDSITLVSNFGTKNLYYGSGNVMGENLHDMVCISDTGCAQNFSFLNVMMQSGLDAMRASGIVGMSPNHFEKQGDLFIEKMRDSGVIDEAIFSIYIDLKNDNSKISFGGYDLK